AGEDRLRGEPADRAEAEGIGLVAWRRDLYASLPALLAMQEPRDLPRHRSVVRLDGEERSPEEGAGGDRQPRALDSEVGPRPHLRHDSESAGLVPLPPARVGRTDPRVRV